MKIPKNEYEIYYPLYNNELTKLNLDLCKSDSVNGIEKNFRRNQLLCESNCNFINYDDQSGKVICSCDNENNITKKELEIKNRTELIQNMINNLFEQLNIANIDDGNDKNISLKHISTIITSTKNQKNNENENIITIDLCECEYILKYVYNISKIILYIFYK